MIGALPLLAAAAALLRRFRLAAALAAALLKVSLEALPWALAAAVCLSRVYLGAHFPLDVVAWAGLGILIGSVLNLIFGVPSISSSTPRAYGLQ